jgi:hypothetical protein
MLETAARLLQILCASAAIVVARREAKHRPVAWFLVGTMLADLARKGLERTGVFDLPGPYTGWAAVVGHAEKALFLSWDASLLALTIALCLSRPPWSALIAWLVAVDGLALAYPWLRAERLQRFYLATDVLTLVVAVALVVGWVKRGAGADKPGGELACLFVLLCVELGRILVLSQVSIFASWERAQWMYCGLYGTLLMVQGGMVWSISPSRS